MGNIVRTAQLGGNFWTPQKSKLIYQVVSPIHESGVHGKGQGYIYNFRVISIFKVTRVYEITKRIDYKAKRFKDLCLGPSNT